MGPNRANEYQYQTQIKERKVGRLTYASENCDCGNETLTCNYDLFESWHTRTRNYTRGTGQYGNWSAWDANPQIPGYDDRPLGQAIIIDYH